MTDILLLSVFLGIATWHISRVIADGSIFASLRSWLRTSVVRYELTTYDQRFVEKRQGNFLLRFIHDVVLCRLCLNTQVAIGLTLLVSPFTINVSDPTREAMIPLLVAQAFVIAGVAEIFRRVEILEV